jgi:hypothetical protein
MRERGISLYNVHAPLDMHPRFSPSRLMAEGTGMTIVDEFFPIAEGLAGGAAIIAEGDVTTEELAERLRRVLGNEVPVQVVASARVRLRRIAFVGGGGADPAILAEALERRADAYVTGNAITRCWTSSNRPSPTFAPVRKPRASLCWTARTTARRSRPRRRWSAGSNSGVCRADLCPTGPSSVTADCRRSSRSRSHPPNPSSRS